MDELRRQRHDLRHQLTAIQGLAGPDNGPLRQYLDGLLNAIPAVPQTYCENQTVNAVVSHYAALCRGAEGGGGHPSVRPRPDGAVHRRGTCASFSAT